MNKLNTSFTTNRTLTLQNFTWGGADNPYLKPLLYKSFVKKLFMKIILKNMIKFTVYL